MPTKLSSLPPMNAAFKPSSKRPHYQTTLWKATVMPSPLSLDLLKNGWKKKSSTLQPVYLIEGHSVAPDEALNLSSNGCNTDCKSAINCCTKSSLACTEVQG